MLDYSIPQCDAEDLRPLSIQGRYADGVSCADSLLPTTPTLPPMTASS